MESDGNQLASGCLVFNAIYTSLGRNKSCLYVKTCKNIYIMVVSMRTVSIPNIGVKVWTHKNEFPQGNYLRSLTHPEIRRVRSFKLTDIEYD